MAETEAETPTQLTSIWMVTDPAVDEVFPFQASLENPPEAALSIATICGLAYLDHNERADWVKTFFVSYPNESVVEFYLSNLTEDDYKDFGMEITHGRVFEADVSDARIPESDIEDGMTPEDVLDRDGLFVGGRVDRIYDEGFSEDAVVTREDFQNETVRTLYAKLKEYHG